MLSLKFTDENRSNIIRSASEILEKSGVIAYPTESFYALGALATDEDAIKNVFNLKGRPADKPLPLIVGDTDILNSLVKTITASTERLIDKFWPGPLTLVFEARKEVSRLLTGKSRKVAIRIPGESAALYLARELRMPITATSANPASLKPSESADEIVSYFGDQIDLIIDGGKSPGGLPSTIVDITTGHPVILRAGRITEESILKVL